MYLEDLRGRHDDSLIDEHLEQTAEHLRATHHPPAANKHELSFRSCHCYVQATCLLQKTEVAFMKLCTVAMEKQTCFIVSHQREDDDFPLLALEPVHRIHRETLARLE